MAVTIRQYYNADFYELTEFLSTSMEFDSPGERIIKEKLTVFQDEADNAYVAINNGKIVGFMQGVTRELFGETIAYIKLMSVHPEYRRQGIARKLYIMVETNFKFQNIQKIKIYDVPYNYFLPGIDPRYTAALCFAEAMGFARTGDVSNLKVDLNQNWNTKESEEKLFARDILIKRIDDNDRREILAFLEIHFPLWRKEVETSMKQSPKAVHIARQNTEIIGFAAYDGNNIGTGSFGPMGTHPEYRHLGIGEVLLKRCLYDLKKQGFEKAIIPWVGPISFYARKANASIDRIFWRYEKDLKIS